jgi:hypothetical protein
MGERRQKMEVRRQRGEATKRRREEATEGRREGAECWVGGLGIGDLGVECNGFVRPKKFARVGVKTAFLRRERGFGANTVGLEWVCLLRRMDEREAPAGKLRMDGKRSMVSF